MVSAFGLAHDTPDIRTQVFVTFALSPLSQISASITFDGGRAELGERWIELSTAGVRR